MIQELWTGQVFFERLLQDHGYLMAFLVVLAEFSGLPLPAGLALLFLGALAPAVGLSPAGIALVAVPAALVPETAWFLVGRRRGLGLIRLYCKVTLGSRSCTERTSLFFERLGPRTMLIAKFVPGLSSFATPMAGLSGVSLASFWLWNGAGTLLWAGAWIAAGRAIGPSLVHGWIDQIHGAGANLIWVVAAVFAGYLGMKLITRARYGPPGEESLS